MIGWLHCSSVMVSFCVRLFSVRRLAVVVLCNGTGVWVFALAMNSLRSYVVGLDLASKRRKVIHPGGSSVATKAGPLLLA